MAIGRKHGKADVHYWQFPDWGYQKPTRFWGSNDIASLPPVLCNPETCLNMVHDGIRLPKHVERLGENNMKFSSRAKGRIPARAIEYLVQGMAYRLEREQPVSPAKAIVQDRFLHPPDYYRINQVTHHNKSSQLVMEVAALHGDDHDCIIKLLIDSGAAENLIRRGVFPDDYFYPLPRFSILSWLMSSPSQGAKG